MERSAGSRQPERDCVDNPNTTLLNGNQKLINLNVLPFSRTGEIQKRGSCDGAKILYIV